MGKNTPRFIIDSNVFIDADNINVPDDHKNRVMIARNAILKAKKCGDLLISNSTKRDLEKALERLVKEGKTSSDVTDNLIKTVESNTKKVGVPDRYNKKNIKKLMESGVQESDWPFLALADARDAILISRDGHLLNNKYRDVTVLHPHDFAKLPLQERDTRKHRERPEQQTHLPPQQRQNTEEHQGTKKQPGQPSVPQDLNIPSDADIATAKTVASTLMNNQHVMTGELLDEGHEQTAMQAARQSTELDRASAYKSAFRNLQRQLGSGVKVMPPPLNRPLGPGTLTVDARLAVLKLSSSQVVAYDARDVAAVFPEEGKYEVKSITRTKTGIEIERARTQQRPPLERGGIER